MMATYAIPPTPAARFHAALSLRGPGRLAGAEATDGAGGAGDSPRPYCEVHPEDPNCNSARNPKPGPNNLTAPNDVTGDRQYIDPNSPQGRAITAMFAQLHIPLPLGVSNLDGQAGPFINVGPIPTIMGSPGAPGATGSTPGGQPGLIAQFTAQLASSPGMGWAVLLGGGVLLWAVFAD